MLKMTKSANKSVIDEARNHRDTSATLAGRNQCDNDDYGYVSNTANSIYDKLMKKYESNPEPEDKFAKLRKAKAKELAVTGDPKFQPFRKPEEKPKPEASVSHQPYRGPSTSSSSDPKKSSSSSVGSSKPIKKVNSAPPPPSFAELMKMAKNKKGEPQPKDLKPVNKNKEGEFDRPMTAAQKEEYMRERNSQLRKAGKLPPSTSKSTPASSSKPSDTKKNGTSEEPKSSKSSILNDALVGKGPCKENGFRQPCMKPGGAVKRDFNSVESRAFPGEVQKPKSKTPPPKPAKRDFHSVESRPFPGEVVPKSKSRRDRSPSPVQMQRKSGSSKSANRIESDSEYDSEMDDFIDDSDCKMDVSAEISKLFGYNRHKYRDDDFDDRSMENNRFSSIMKEEAYSAKMGRQEDLEDMRREEEENRKKAMRKKQKGGGGRSRY